MVRLHARTADACAAALADETVQAAASKLRGVDGDAPTAAPSSRGAKRPSKAAVAAPVAKRARGTLSSKYIGALVEVHRRLVEQLEEQV
mmetsp:Transcript_8878/g.31263  ORF Transcript_8878/g.31263 Transcript_8878/m.31263 type:complete len:89 (-) Transcript_8878:225-491(-)